MDKGIVVLFGLVLQVEVQIEALPGLCRHFVQKPLYLATLIAATEGA
jgi:hypothetical protein